MSQSPLISVVIACYQHENFVVEAIKSVLDQSFQDFEIIITDDGSSDNSVQKIKTIKDKRINLFEFKENQGACAAMNNCIMNASGEYIAVINSDDVWLPDKLEKQMQIFMQDPSIHAVFSDAYFLKEDLSEFSTNKQPYFFSIFKQSNRSQGEWLRKFFFEKNCLCHPSILIKKSCYDVLGLYDNRYRQLPDFDMWIRFCKKYSLHVLPDKLVKFRVLSSNKNTSSPTISNQLREINEHYFIMQSFFDNMEIKIFKEAFLERLINKDFTTLDEFEIEKAMLYLKTPYSIIGLEKLFFLLSRKDFAKLLRESYGITDKEFQNISSNVIGFEQESMDVILNALCLKLKKYPKLKLVKTIIRKFIYYLSLIFIKN
jgi:glycosyltransferase involved in cell wall biosynthesis